MLFSCSTTHIPPTAVSMVSVGFSNDSPDMQRGIITKNNSQTCVFQLMSLICGQNKLIHYLKRSHEFIFHKVFELAVYFFFKGNRRKANIRREGLIPCSSCYSATCHLQLSYHITAGRGIYIPVFGLLPEFPQSTSFFSHKVQRECFFKQENLVHFYTLFNCF